MYKKNLMKLLPAVAVIIAIAAAGFQQDSEVKSTKTVQAAENELIKSDELTSLLTTAYFNDGGMKDTDEADSSILKTKKSKSKIKKAGIIKFGFKYEGDEKFKIFQLSDVDLIYWKNQL